MLLSSYRSGLPEGLSLPPRSPAQMRRPFSLSDGVLAFRRVTLDGGQVIEQ